MNTNKTYNITIEPPKQLYSQILYYSLQFCDKFILIERKHFVTDDFKYNKNKLDEYLLNKENVTKYPGNELYGENNYVISNCFTLNEHSINLLLELSNSLYDWLYPTLPEDLILLRTDGQPWLISIAHEKDAWFEVTEEEMEQMRCRIKGIDSIIKMQ